MHTYIAQIHTYMQTYIHMYTHTYITKIHMHLHTQLHAYIHTCMQTFMHYIPLHPCMHAYITYGRCCKCTCINTCIHTYFHTYINTHIHILHDIFTCMHHTHTDNTYIIASTRSCIRTLPAYIHT